LVTGPGLPKESGMVKKLIRVNSQKNTGVLTSTAAKQKPSRQTKPEIYANKTAAQTISGRTQHRPVL